MAGHWLGDNDSTWSHLHDSIIGGPVKMIVMIVMMMLNIKDDEDYTNNK